MTRKGCAMVRDESRRTCSGRGGTRKGRDGRSKVVEMVAVKLGDFFFGWWQQLVEKEMVAL